MSDPSYWEKMIKHGIQEYMTECSMMKVYCSEVLDYCVDECVQIHGGYGYTQEYNAERYYRDSRINRIFEGTNEINRMIIAGDVLKKAAKNHLPIFAQAKELLAELMGIPEFDMDEDESFMAAEKKLVAQAKKAAMLSLGTVAQELGEKLKAPMEHEEILGLLSDTITDIYAMECCVLRSIKLQNKGDAERAKLAGAMTELYCNDALHRIDVRTRDLLAAVTAGDTLTTTLAGLRRVVKHTPSNTVALRREIADALIAKEKWPF